LPTKMALIGVSDSTSMWNKGSRKE
jgi:hypothetical protein